ncbi:hypothetical protein [Phenylobacterium sp.]|uniref:hypothetical protein n=1 Tax=Phenylobacterium sp. TaxID=1871053 RepID=UPI00286C2BD1|nr:hypothetical protein [Phenylobacterium sp.]
MGDLYVVLEWIRDLKIDPLAAVIVAAILAAYVEQRLARRRMADLTSARPDETALREARREGRRRRRRGQ